MVALDRLDTRATTKFDPFSLKTERMTRLGKRYLLHRYCRAAKLSVLSCNSGFLQFLVLAIYLFIFIFLDVNHEIA